MQKDRDMTKAGKRFVRMAGRSTLGLVLGCIGMLFIASGQPINRQTVVTRHNVQVTSFDTLSSLTVGNGAFAFTVDATGLQTFPDAYAHGVPLGTQSEWGWNSFPNTQNYRLEEAIKTYHLQGRDVPYAVQWNEKGRHKDAADFLRQNPHRLQLGNIGFEILKEDGTMAGIKDISGIHQQLNLWTGIITSIFTVDGKTVEVETASHHAADVVAVKVKSALLQEGRMRIRIALPYPTGGWADMGNNFAEPGNHFSEITSQDAGGATIHHRLESADYSILCRWQSRARMHKARENYFVIEPEKADDFACSFSFLQTNQKAQAFTAQQVFQSSSAGWPAFWKSGAAVDFAGSADPRASEIERRVVLSQYLTRVQCAGHFPPQETGLTYNSWYGKPHLEMHWWHAVHFALWARPQLLEQSLDWYFKVFDEAKAIAQRQGYQGVRWQKMVDHSGKESPSSVGAFLIWQQPHVITMANLLYRQKHAKAVLEKYSKLVFATADFMASYAWYDSSRGRYLLGPGLIPAQERFKPEQTFNPSYELNYWYWALETAQQWRQKLGMPRKEEWDAVLQKLSPLPVKDGVYLATESAPDSHTNPAYKTDHPAVLGTLGMLPATRLTDSATMRRTFDLVWNTWTWDDTWGWDFPMTAMTATRLGMPDKAIDALLMPIRTNTYLPNGHNYQDARLTIYLPGNGGILAAIALMLAGYDGCKTSMPGIPKDGTWKVKWEGLQKMD